MHDPAVPGLYKFIWTNFLEHSKKQSTTVELMWLKNGIGILIVVIMIFMSYSLVEELLKRKLMRL